MSEPHTTYMLRFRLRDDMAAGEVLAIRCCHFNATRGTTPQVLSSSDSIEMLPVVPLTPYGYEVPEPE